jgi:steroid delta-isomerase-like uncharacterized protein
MTSTDQNKAIVRRYYDEVLNQGRWETVQEIFDPAFLSHAPGVITVNLDRYQQLAHESRTAFPDLHVTIDDQIAEGDKVVTRWTAHATHQGPMMGIPPTGKALWITAIHIHRLANGKLIEHWEEINMLGVLKHLGVIK